MLVQPGEAIIVDYPMSPFWTLLRYPLTLGFWEFWRLRRRFIVTNQRVVSTKGIVTRTERAVPLSRVQDVTLRTSIFAGGYVVLSSAGGSLGIEHIGPLSRANARRFADALQSQLQKPPMSPSV